MAYKTPHTVTINLQGSSSSPNDSTTYYLGGEALSLSTAGSVIRRYVPKQGRIVAVQLMMYCGVNGSGENVEVYLRINNSTDHTLSTTFQMNADIVTLYVDNLNVEVTTDDYFAIKFVTPVWVTNPASVYPNADIILECD